ncbi:MAG: ABC transporter substrate-binding protein [Anaerolineaceae bacterium]|nr:ABC transporter substrate-binding protein [Anaerolineaceae bacterium]
MRRTLFALSLILVFGLILSACSPAPTPTPTTAPAVEESAPTEAAVEVVLVSEPEGCLGTAEDAIVDLGCREITIAVENAYLPFNYISLETGEPGGWDYDVWNEICTRLHCTPVYTEAAWEGLIQAISDGQYDVGADGITVTADRAEIVDFSMGYININQRLLVRRGEDRFDSIESFVANESLQIGTQSQTTNYETAASYLPEDRISAFEQFPFAVQALMTEEIDAVMIDQVAGMGYMGENAESLDFIGPKITSEALGFIYPQGSDLVGPVDQALQSMMDDGFLQGVNAFYFGPDFDITYDDIAE